MEATIPRCVNHPDVETRLSCSNCGDPICTRCMRQGAVGQKCPRCARVPRSARALGKPRHYVRSVVVGVSVAVASGFLAGLLGGVVPFIGLILPALLGLAVGRAVAWGGEGQNSRPFVTIAAGCAVLGALVYVWPSTSVWALVAVLISGYVAVRALGR